MAKWPPLAAVGSALIVALLAAGLLTSLTPRADAEGTCETGSATLDSAELDMLRLHNEMRAQNGLSPLVLSPGLSQMAAWKSGDASADGSGFTHTDTLGRGPTQRAADCGYPGDAAENIAYGFPTVAATFDAWMKSSGHKTNILMSYYTMIGIGRVGDRWTVNFGLVDDNARAASMQAPAPAAPIPPTPVPAAPTVIPEPGEWLPAGATLVTYEGPPMPVGEAVASLGENLRFVYAFNESTGKWQRYAPGRPRYVNSLQYLTTGAQYFVGVRDDARWTW